MVKEIDVGAAQMGIEVLTNKGSEENPTKSVEIQKPPEKPYTITDHSKMFEAMGQPEKAAELKQKAIDTLTEEGKKMSDIDNVVDVDAEKEKRRQKSRELAAEYNRRQEAGEDTTELEGTKAEQGNPGGLEIAIRPKLAVNIMRVDIPLNVIEEINNHIDDVTIPNGKDHSKGLVGQISRNEKSAQYTFDTNDEVGGQFVGVIEKLGKEFMKRGWDKDVESKCQSAWTVHSYEGDYNPLHDHGVATQMGLSCILYLKVPKQITDLPNPSDEDLELNGSSGQVDGFTQLVWGSTGMRDVNMLRPLTSEYVKPEVGTLIMFPSWLRHSVNPFFGEGERRTFSANFQITEKM